MNHLNRENIFSDAYKVSDISKLINNNQYSHIGFMPNECHYPTMIKRLLNSDISSLRKITFYHLNKGDYSTLYNYQG